MDWISPLHDHARVSFTVGDTVWGNIQTPKPDSTPPSIIVSDKLNLEQMLPLLSVVDETCTLLALQFLDSQSPISSNESVHQILETHRSMFLKLTPKKEQEKSRDKLLPHRNTEQRETISHIVSLQKALDKPLHFYNIWV